MKVLVTGSNGFIGRNLCPALERAGHEVTGFARSDGRDIRDPLPIGEAATGQDAIVHLAAMTGVAQSVADPREAVSVNVEGSLNVLEAARRAGVGQIIAASTGGAIAGNTAPPVGEGTIPAPQSPYGATKLAMEGLLSAYAASYGMTTCALRFANVYGPHSERKAGAVTAFCKALRAGRPLVVFGDGKQVRDYVHVDDIVVGVMAALGARATGVFALGTGIGTSLNDLIEHLARVSGVVPRVDYKLARPGEVAATWTDITKARDWLDYRPCVEIEDGLARTWEWSRDLA